MEVLRNLSRGVRDITKKLLVGIVAVPAEIRITSHAVFRLRYTIDTTRTETLYQ